MFLAVIFCTFLISFWFWIYPATDYYVRWIAPGVIRRGRKDPRPKICLTFDDGPNPETTPQILDLLKERAVPAVFFLVGQRAATYPALVQRMVAEGHEIGLHTHQHTHAYGLLASQSIKTIGEGWKVLSRISGVKLRWFRPPWGACNLFQYFAARQLNLQLVLWSANAQDWQARTGVAGILRRLKKRVRPGSVIVLHDAGGEPGAPANTVAALPEFISYCKERGWQFATLEDMAGGLKHERPTHTAAARTSH